MKRSIPFLLSLALMSQAKQPSESIEPAFVSGDNLISAGFYYYEGPGASVVWDHRVRFAKSFSIGSQLAGSFTSNESYYTALMRLGYHPLSMPQASKHLRIAKVLDPYILGALGVTHQRSENVEFATSSGESDETIIAKGDFTHNNLDYAIALGVHLMITPKFGLWGEAGTHFCGGVTYKI